MVSHGDTIRIAVAELLGEDLADAPWRQIDNGSVTTHPRGYRVSGRRP